MNDITRRVLLSVPVALRRALLAGLLLMLVACTPGGGSGGDGGDGGDASPAASPGASGGAGGADDY